MWFYYGLYGSVTPRASNFNHAIWQGNDPIHADIRVDFIQNVSRKISDK